MMVVARARALDPWPNAATPVDALPGDVREVCVHDLHFGIDSMEEMLLLSPSRREMWLTRHVYGDILKGVDDT